MGEVASFHSGKSLGAYVDLFRARCAAVGGRQNRMAKDWPQSLRGGSFSQSGPWESLSLQRGALSGMLDILLRGDRKDQGTGTDPRMVLKGPSQLYFGRAGGS
jgi:hypothetical protein